MRLRLAGVAAAALILGGPGFAGQAWAAPADDEPQVTTQMEEETPWTQCVAYTGASEASAASPATADGPADPNGPYGPFGPFGPFEPYEGSGQFGPFGPYGPYGPGTDAPSAPQAPDEQEPPGTQEPADITCPDQPTT
jgi:hypothetical protein